MVRSILQYMSVAFVLLLVLFPGSARSGARDHEDSLFLRMSVGAGDAASHTNWAGGVDVTGIAGDLSIAIGAMVAPDLAVHATYFGWATTSPHAEFDNVSGDFDATLSLRAIGVGFTLFFMPGNVYFSTSAGVGKLTLDTDRFDSESELGYATDVSVGKEWWLGRGWGMGAAIGISSHSLSDELIESYWSGATPFVRLSATLN